MIVLFWCAIKGRSHRDGCVFTSGPESKNRCCRLPVAPVNGEWSAGQQDQELPLPRHVVSTLQHIDWIEHPVVAVLMGTEEVVVSDPECHVIVGAIIIVVTAADPVSGFKCAVKPFDHLLVGAELLRDRIIVCEPNYLGDVKPEAVPQFPCELLGGQGIGTISVGNKPELFGQPFHAPESHAHGKDARPDGAVV